MSEADVPKSRIVAVASYYALAVVSVAVALTATVLLNPDGLVGPLFFLAIILSAWFGGVGPGLVAALLSTLSISYFLLPPLHSVKFNAVHLPQLLVFFVSAVLVSSWSAVRRRDETALRQAQAELEDRVRDQTAELRDSETRFRTFVDHATDAFFLHDDQLKLRDVNRQACESLGYSREELLGLRPRDFDVGLDEAAIAQLADRVRAGETISFETRHRRKNGTEFPVEVRVRPFKHEGDWFFIGLARDITERKRVQEELAASEAELRALFASMTDPVMVLDRDGRYLKIAPNNQRLLYRPLDELVGKTMHDVFPKEQADLFLSNIRTAMNERKAVNTEYPLPMIDGQERWFSTTASPMTKDTVVCVARDITERKRAEEERERLHLLQAELAHFDRINMLGELAASLAHELNQPIAAAVTSAGACLRWLNREQPEVQRAREAVVRIENDGKRAAEIINRLRAFYKKEVSLERELVDVNEIAREMIAMLNNEANRHSVSMRAELANGLPLVKADRVQLQQVFMNLMLNAIEAMREAPGKLTIQAEQSNGHILVTVSDTGMGLPPGKTNDLFNAFFTSKPDGTGMGLAISRSIIESHGGRLWADANPGLGATFHFTLPIQTEA